MKLNTMPLYCGGRFLYGLHTYSEVGNGGYSRSKIIQDSLRNPVRGYDSVDAFPFIPEDLLGFQQILKYQTNGDNIGVIYAVTNPSQKIAARFLEQTGFVKAGTFAKIAGNPCVTWFGDFNKDVKPILDKIPFFEEGRESKFSSVSLSSEITTQAVFR